MEGPPWPGKRRCLPPAIEPSRPQRRGQKKARSWKTAPEDSTIGGEWRNVPAVPKEEYGEAADETILPYCNAQRKRYAAMQHGRTCTTVAHYALSKQSLFAYPRQLRQEGLTK